MIRCVYISLRFLAAAFHRRASSLKLAIIKWARSARRIIMCGCTGTQELRVGYSAPAPVICRTCHVHKKAIQATTPVCVPPPHAHQGPCGALHQGNEARREGLVSHLCTESPSVVDRREAECVMPLLLPLTEVKPFEFESEFEFEFEFECEFEP